MMNPMPDAPLILVTGATGYVGGRRDPDELRVGDPLAFWRGEMVEPGRLIRLLMARQTEPWQRTGDNRQSIADPVSVGS